MKQSIIHLFTIVIIVLLFTETIAAQNGAPSAYTNFGVGRIESAATVKYQGMGGAGIALPSQYSVNSLNPASLSSIKSEQMLIDFGIRSSYTNYEHDTESGNGLSGGLNNINLAFRSGKRWVTSFNISQYSSVGYNILSTDYIEGTTMQISKSYEGSGGLNKLAMSNSLTLGKNLSLGLELSYIFGKLTKQENYYSSVIGGELDIEYADFLQQIYLEAGFQYKIPLAKSNVFVGATYSPEANFKTSREVVTSSTSGAGIYEDLDRESYKIPATYGGGLGWMNHHGIQVAVDYRFQNWANIDYGNSLANYKDSHRFSGGLEYQRRKSRRANPYTWRLGGYYEDSYIEVKGKTILDRGITAGIGIPMRSKNSYLNMSINYGQRGTANNTLITENYYGISVSMSMLEGWFRKRQFE
ncbi:hypothetical protein [Saccharicrinis sp. 156]|uniref:hypothetical protein n=1 Tax=Saccharicrinis sp. 156 TaxID=3417574 RepID=UPI003D347522